MFYNLRMQPVLRWSGYVVLSLLICVVLLWLGVVPVRLAH